MAISTIVSNLQTVQAIYEAFGKGDIPTILNQLTNNVLWEHMGNPQIIPFAGTYNGKDEVLQFFQKVGQNSQFNVFQPQNFREAGNQVVNDVYMESIALPTGKSATLTATFYWTFDDNGKVTHWKNEGGLDTLEAAFI